MNHGDVKRSLQIVLLFLFIVFNARSQSSLKLASNVQFQLSGETFLLDTLTLGENSQLLLDKRHNDCFIRINLLIVEGKASIIGLGNPGMDGPDGEPGPSINSPHTYGRPGRPGSVGINLTLNFSDIIVRDTLDIILTGGDGGTGGVGGYVDIPRASVAKMEPNVSVRPTQGHGGDGGQGGDGGKVIISFPRDYEKIVKDMIVIKNWGGKGALSGTPPENKIPRWFFEQEKNGAEGKKGSVTQILLRR